MKRTIETETTTLLTTKESLAVWAVYGEEGDEEHTLLTDGYVYAIKVTDGSTKESERVFNSIVPIGTAPESITHWDCEDDYFGCVWEDAFDIEYPEDELPPLEDSKDDYIYYGVSRRDFS